jgi:hypothetical protein
MRTITLCTARRPVALLIVVAAACLITACSSGTQLPAKVPSNISAIEHSSKTARALTARHYLPSYVLTGNGNYAWTVCPHTDSGAVTDLTACSESINSEGTNSTPNVFVVGGKIKYLEGTRSRTDENDDTFSTTVWVPVPARYQNLGSLSKAQQDWLLGLPQIAAKHFEHSLATSATLQIVADGQQIQLHVRTGTTWPTGLK